jgi:hypothetical protein
MNKHLVLYPQIKGLRTRGLTYSEINKKLGTDLPKSSLSYICREIKLSETQIARIDNLTKSHLEVSRQKAVIANLNIQKKQLEDLQNQNIEFNKLSKREAKIALAFLYLGEGSKRTSFRGLALGSSDPKIITLYMTLLNICYGINHDEFKCRILYRADQNLNDLEAFWSGVTNIPRSSFYKTKPDSRTKGRPTLRENYKGVCVLYRKGAKIQLELQVITDIIFEAMGM